eukprot:jgi/Tetstr1/440974/TSEL_029242.t1
MLAGLWSDPMSKRTASEHPGRRSVDSNLKVDSSSSSIGVVAKSPHSATLAVLHKRDRHNYGRGPVRALRVVEHNIAGDLIIPCPEMWPLPGPPPYEILSSGHLRYLHQGGAAFPVKDAEQSGKTAGKPTWLRLASLLWLLPWTFIVFLVLTALGTWLLIEHRHMEDWFGMQLWRWTLWVASCIGMSTLTSVTVKLATSLVERHCVVHQRVLYFTVALTRPTQALLQALQITSMFVLFCGVHDAKMDVLYSWLLKACQCLCLFRAVCLLSTALAKGASSYFYKSKYFDNIHDALMKEYYLQRLAMAKPTRPLSPQAMSRHVSFYAILLLPPQCEETSSAAMGAPVERSCFSLNTAVMTNKAVHKFKKLPLRRQAQHAGAGARPEVPSRLKLASSSSTLSGRPPQPAGGAASIEVDLRQPSELGTSRFSPAGPRRRAHHRSISMAEDMISSPRLYPADPAPHTAMKQDSPTESKAREPATQLHAEPAVPPGSTPETETCQQQRQLERNILSMTVTISDKVSAAFNATAMSKEQLEQEARQLALYIFWNLKSEFDAMHITKADLEPLLSKAQVDRCMAFLDLDGDQRVSLQELRDAVIKIYQDRRRLAMQLQDRDTIVGRLESVLSILLHTLSILGYLYIFHVDIASMWFTFSSVLLAMSFVFGNSVRTIYESAIYIFLVHPFDVGDTIVISQRMYTVEAINLIVVTLRHTDGSHVYQPISLLCTLPLSNLTRSANKREMLTLLMDYRSESAFGSTMDRVRQCVRAYVTANPSNLAPDFYVNAAPAENPLKIKLLVRYTFTCPGENPVQLDIIRGELSLAISRGLHAAGARFTLPPQVIETIPPPPELQESVTSRPCHA